MRIHIPRVSWSWLFVPLLLAVLVAVLAYPVALLFIKSFALTRPGQPTVWGLEGWLDAFSDRGLPMALLNTFTLAAVRNSNNGHYCYFLRLGRHSYGHAI